MYEKELEAAIKAAKRAETKIKEIYKTDFAVEIKGDDSPVTLADKTADAMIREDLSKEFPDYGFLTEESVDTKERLKKKAIWIVDPVDGTKEFVSRNGQFTTNIALAVDHEVVVGVINVPMLDVLYFAIKGQGSYRLNKDGTRTQIHCSTRTEGLRTVRSISFFNEKEKAFYQKHQDRFEGEAAPIGAANKFCVIAQGDYDFFYRMSSGTKEWDVAAGDLLIHEAGGAMVQPNGLRFHYNREDVYNREGYIIANTKDNLILK